MVREWETSLNGACEYAARKCLEHLHRSELARQLALHALRKGLPEHLELLAARSFEQGPSSRLEQVVHEAHFIALKTNFELFLNRVGWSLWLHHFDALSRQHERSLGKDKVSISDVIGWLDDVKGGIIDHIVPAHGLEGLCSSLKTWTGIDVIAALNRCEPTLWPQIFAAFQVRHVIEHRNGRMDRAFVKSVNSVWRSDLPSVLRPV